MKRRKLSVESVDMVFMFLALGTLLFYLWRVRYGYAQTDEQCVFAWSNALIKGDCLIIDEWHPAQLWNVLLFPLTALYNKITTTCDGIVLAFRSVFVICHTFVCGTMYYVLRKYSKLIAICSFLIMELYIPFGIMCFGYNICAIWSIILIMFLSNTDTGKNKYLNGVRNFLIGVAIASLVLCNPLSVFLYLGQLLYLIIGITQGKYSKWNAIFVHVGILIMLFLFASLVYKGGSLIIFAKEIWHNFPMMLSDGSHGAKNIQTLISPITGFIAELPIFPLIFACFAILGSCIRKIQPYCMVGILINAIAFFIYMAIHMEWYGNMHPYLIFPPIGVIAYVWMHEKPHKLFRTGYLMSCIYSMLVNYTSNNGILIVAHGLSLAAAISMVFIFLWIQENRYTQSFIRKVLIIALFVAILIQLFMQGYVRLFNNFWEDNTKELSSVITVGPQKGLHTTLNKKEMYEQQEKEIESIEATSDDYILFFCERCDGYLMTSAHVGGYSSYCYEDASPETDRFVKYYQLHPTRIPSIIYVDANSVRKQPLEYWDDFCARRNYLLEVLPSGSYLLRTK